MVIAVLRIRGGFLVLPGVHPGAVLKIRGNPMKRLSRLVFAVAVLGFVAVAVRPVLADSIDPDPTIEAGVIATLPGGATAITETSDTWTYSNTDSSPYLVYFKDSTGVTWSDMTIVAVAGGSSSTSHTYTDETFNSSLFATGTTAAFSTLVAANPPGPVTGAPPVTFEQSGGTGVAAGDYLVIRLNNWPTNPDSTFTFTMSTPTEDARVPEPSSGALLSIGLLALFGLVGFTKCRKAGIAVA